MTSSDSLLLLSESFVVEGTSKKRKRRASFWFCKILRRTTCSGLLTHVHDV